MIKLWRIGILVWTLLVTILTLSNFVVSGSLPHDENLFQSVQSRLLVVKPFPAKPLYVSKIPNQARDLNQNTVQVGDLVLALGEPVSDEAELKAALRAVDDFAKVELLVFRPSILELRSYMVSKAMIPSDFYRVIPNAVVVRTVQPGGSSDRAGMRPGDLITAINGRTFTDATAADRIMRQTHAGSRVEYRIVRGSQELSLILTMAKFTIPASLFVLKFCGLLILWSGGAMVLARPSIKAARLSGLALALFGTGLALFIGSQFAQAFINGYPQIIIQGICLFFGAAALVHSRFYFPIERAELLHNRFLRYFPYVLALWGFLASARFRENAIFPTIGALLFYQAILNWKFAKRRSPESVQVAKILNATANSGLILAAIMFYTATRRGGANSFGFLGLPLLLIPMGYWFTVVKYELLDIHLKIKRSFQYSMVSFGWAIFLFVGFLWTLTRLPNWQWPGNLPQINVSLSAVEVLDSPLTEAARHAQEKKILMIIALVLGAISWRIGKTGQRWIDRKFHRAGYDYRRSSSELADVLSRQLSMKDLGEALIKKIAELMFVKQAGLIVFAQNNRSPLVSLYGHKSPDFGEALTREGQHYARAVSNFFGEVQIDYLPKNIKDILRKEGFSYLSPIHSKDRLLGVILVGDKLSEAPFTQEDLVFLNATSKQIAVSIENGLLYEQVALQERLRHELEIARTIQLSSLPQETPRVPGLTIAALSQPATEVGGDYFDYLPRENGVCVLVGDVSGKGTSAALHMSKLQGIIRCLGEKQIRPAQLFCEANPMLYRNLDQKSFVTAIACQFDTVKKQALVARAGHLPLYVYHPGIGVKTYQPPGIGLGLENSGKFRQIIEEMIIPYECGDIFVLVSDGVTEAFNQHSQTYGDEALRAVIEANATQNAEHIRDAIRLAIQEFAGNTPQADDMTILVVKAVPQFVQTDQQENVLEQAGA
ncbi:MAG: SpoIIE family protein phosphatase [Acidobacteria bacterium]|nr:SpoIIE family protein phosphatase [Acidobacteriota bacterium]